MSDDARQVTIRESMVMGRLAIVNATLWLAAAAVVQLTGFPGSRAITEAGGREFDVVWSACLIVAAVLACAAWWVGRTPELGGAATILESGANTLMILGVGIYLTALLVVDRMGPPPPADYPQWLALLEGRLVLFALAIALITNTIGRNMLLVRQIRWARRLRDHV